MDGRIRLCSNTYGVLYFLKALHFVSFLRQVFSELLCLDRVIAKSDWQVIFTSNRYGISVQRLFCRLRVIATGSLVTTRISCFLLLFSLVRDLFLLKCRRFIVVLFPS